MMMLPSGVKVHIAAGVTDMRKGMDGLASGQFRNSPNRVICLQIGLSIHGVPRIMPALRLFSGSGWNKLTLDQFDCHRRSLEWSTRRARRQA